MKAFLAALVATLTWCVPANAAVLYQQFNFGGPAGHGVLFPSVVFTATTDETELSFTIVAYDQYDCVDIGGGLCIYPEIEVQYPDVRAVLDPKFYDDLLPGCPDEYSCALTHFNNPAVIPTVPGAQYVISMEIDDFGSTHNLVEFDEFPVVPEPAGWALLLSGFLALGLALRRPLQVV